MLLPVQVLWLLFRIKEISCSVNGIADIISVDDDDDNQDQQLQQPADIILLNC